QSARVGARVSGPRPGSQAAARYRGRSKVGAWSSFFPSRRSHNRLGCVQGPSTFSRGERVKVVANERLIRRQSKIGAIFLAATFGLLMVGILLSYRPDLWAESLDPWVPIALTYAIVVAGFGLSLLGQRRVRRYGPQHRHHLRLGQLLKGLDDRYVLYAYLD